MTDSHSGGAEAARSVWEEARDLIKRLEGSTVSRLRIQDGDTKIEIERGGAVVVGAAPGPAAVPASATAPDGATTVEDAGHPILSPLVGTFYRAAQPGAKPFVEEGDVVDPGQTVGIVEAMKLMNQVAADIGGRVARIAVEDGAWVEFEQVLMFIEPVEE
jgi:acetyl-CoA carboxylase biotin carboxyl carrier protein